MQYQSLYRKYRPNKFSEVYGQKIAKKILINSLTNGKISHAYLFFGPRGTGKTSLAKMFARICNCENIMNGECCEKCVSCLASKEKNCVDIIEIDAASNNGVDEIRELKSKINLMPNSLKYKIYIIDEVHMLSIGAFNALLKTLEEPPKHAIFILATTEYYKVPATIVSRCQTIEFSNIDNISMKRRLIEICELENVNIEDDGIDEIVKNSNGGLRDAIGLLDKVIAVSEENETITKAIVREVLGNISHDEVILFAECILNKDLDKMLVFLNSFCNNGIDLIKVLDDLILYLKDYILKEQKYELCEKLELINAYQTKMKTSTHKDVLFQILLIEISEKTNVREEARYTKEPIKEVSKSDGDKLQSKNDEYDFEFLKIRINNSFANADKKYLLELKQGWQYLESFSFDPYEGSIICDLLDCVPVVSSEKNVLLTSNYLAIVNKINTDVEKYENILKTKLNLSKKIVVVQSKEWENLKKTYLNNIKNNIKYTYIEERKQTNAGLREEGEGTTLQKAIELFGKVD